MIAGGSFYPYTSKPADVWQSMLDDHDNTFFIDVQARGYYPSYMKSLLASKGVDAIEMADGDEEILKNTVDFVSFSYYASRTSAHNLDELTANEGNVVKSAKNPYLPTSKWRVGH